MSFVLYIKANAKNEGESRTFRIADSFVEAYKSSHPKDKVITLDLYKEGVDFLPVGEIDKLHRPAPGEGLEHPILKYAYQFREADKYIIAEPLWNLSIPAVLKAYIDYITVNGITFRYTEEGAEGLCTGKKAVNITTRGGDYSERGLYEYEMGDKYLRTIFGFLGIRDFKSISVDCLDIIGMDVEGSIQEAIKEARKLAEKF